MAQEKIITCVILNYNDANTTIDLIEKLMGYDTFNYLVVVDNYSSDNSVALLKRYVNKRIKLIEANRNGGYGYGNNIGIRYSYDVLNADYIVISNPDVIFEEKTIINLEKVLASNAKHAIAAPIPLTPEGIRQEIVAWKLTTVWQEMLESSVLYNRIFGLKRTYSIGNLTNNIHYVDVVQGSLFMVDAEIMVKYGMYDEDFFLYSEEQVIGYKLKKHGFKTILLTNESYIHNHSISINKSYKSLIQKKRIYLKSKMLYFKKYNKLSLPQTCLVRLFFTYVIIEALIISFLRLLKHKK
ncbi:MAG TPA: glycosyltransferase [Bacteroidales bacterium]|nr:glycosyltransferase [Bacteroidales bacterium]